MEGSARGNYGLTDQVAALHWIQENIAEFGGDPKNVTLFGHGHGAACVNFLVLSPMGKGLFHRAIMMSGSALSSWAIARNADFYAQQIARTLGCPTNQPAALLECLRQRSVSDILRVQITVPMFLTGFGPTVDGIVIQNEPSMMMEEISEDQKLGLFDLMFGVTKVESYFHISEREEKVGLDIKRRDKLLRTLVRNIFNYHLQEIFLTIVNEYTDWTKAIQHDINILDGTLDALGDALVVAPILKSLNYHALSQKKSYFYVFSYQAEDGKYPQRQGCLPGEDLQFVFGAPLIGTLGHFSKNYSSAEIGFAEAVMTYWVNFARYGDPNFPSEKSTTERSKGRHDRLLWPVYESVHQKYMVLGIKPRVRDHYHAHRLSFWLHLFPQLHSASSANVSPEHHLLDDHDNPQSYDGAVRQIPFSLTYVSGNDTTDATLLSSTSWNRSGSQIDVLLNTVQPNSQTTTNVTMLPTTTINITDSKAAKMQQGHFTAALSITIAVGASFLFLNILIFAGIYYQRDRDRKRAELLKKREYAQRAHDSQMASAAQVKSLSLRAPPPSPVCTTMPQQDLTLHPPPSQHHKLPHKVPPKPCVVPTPPEIAHRERLSEAQPHMKQATTNTLSSRRPMHQRSQDAQVHNHPEIKLQ